MVIASAHRAVMKIKAMTPVMCSEQVLSRSTPHRMLARGVVCLWAPIQGLAEGNQANVAITAGWNEMLSWSQSNAGCFSVQSLCHENVSPMLNTQSWKRAGHAVKEQVWESPLERVPTFENS